MAVDQCQTNHAKTTASPRPDQYGGTRYRRVLYGAELSDFAAKRQSMNADVDFAAMQPYSNVKVSKELISKAKGGSARRRR